MLKHKIQPTITSLVKNVRGTTWTKEEYEKLEKMLDQIKYELALGVQPRTTKTFTEKLKSALSFR